MGFSLSLFRIFYLKYFFGSANVFFDNPDCSEKMAFTYRNVVASKSSLSIIPHHFTFGLILFVQSWKKNHFYRKIINVHEHASSKVEIYINAEHLVQWFHTEVGTVG